MEETWSCIGTEKHSGERTKAKMQEAGKITETAKS
jgi:hypothetical protein